MTKVAGSVALVTGASRGLGLALVYELIAQEASKVYAATRAPQTFDDARIVNIILDVSDLVAIARLPETVPDVTIVINNAGVSSGLLADSSMNDIRDVFETNVFGPIAIMQTLAPVLAQNSGGAVINILSVLSWVPYGVYGVTKAALWSATNALRQELAEQKTQLVGVHVGFMDTDMAKRVEAAKNDPKVVAKKILQAVDAGENEVLVDRAAVYAKSLVSGPVEDLHF